MQLSINELSNLTGKDRRTVTDRLKDLEFSEGPKQAHLYDSKTALAAIYGSGKGGQTLDDARRELAIAQTEVAKAKNEEIRKERIPLEIVRGIWDAALATFGSTLKAARGKVLTPEKINELLGELRKAKLPLKW